MVWVGLQTPETKRRCKPSPSTLYWTPRCRKRASCQNPNWGSLAFPWSMRKSKRQEWSPAWNGISSTRWWFAFTVYTYLNKNVIKKKCKRWTIDSGFLGNLKTITNLHSYGLCTCFKAVYEKSMRAVRLNYYLKVMILKWPQDCSQCL